MNAYETLLTAAKNRHPEQQIEKMPSLASIEEGLIYDEEINIYLFHYHLKGHPSSFCLAMTAEGELLSE